jgi:predicted phage terminase large subunit-like protein
VNTASFRETCPKCKRPTIRSATGQPLFQCESGHTWWAPNPGPQTDFLSRNCFEVMFGGAAGGGKSIALLMGAARHLNRGYGRHFHALLFRRTFPELQDTLIKDAWTLYPQLGGHYTQDDKTWEFPGGEIIQFGHMEHEKDVQRKLGLGVQYVGFDELTTFTERQYRFMFSRIRSGHGVPCSLRSATNPGSEGHEWVFKRWGPWLDPESPVKAKPGEVLYFLRSKDDQDVVVPKGTPLARGRTFIPSKLEDNAPLFAGGEYEAGLNALDPVSRAQQRNGDWLIKPAKGLYFRRDWFHFIDASQVPGDAVRARYWDLAATEAEAGKDPDWTVGCKAAFDSEKRLYVEDVARMRGNPGDVEKFVRATAEMDGNEIPVYFEQEPGASGKSAAAAFIRLLAGWTVRAVRKRTDKVVSAGPVSAQCSANVTATSARPGNVYIVRAPWNEIFIRELEQFPEGSHDDQVDALSGVFDRLTKQAPIIRGGGVNRGAPLERRSFGI